MLNGFHMIAFSCIMLHQLTQLFWNSS